MLMLPQGDKSRYIPRTDFTKPRTMEKVIKETENGTLIHRETWEDGTMFMVIKRKDGDFKSLIKDNQWDESISTATFQLNGLGPCLFCKKEFWGYREPHNDGCKIKILY